MIICVKIELEGRVGDWYWGSRINWIWVHRWLVNDYSSKVKYSRRKRFCLNDVKMEVTERKMLSVQSIACVWLFVTPWTATHQASLYITNSLSLFKYMSMESVMPSNHLILCRPLLLLPSIFPSIRVFSNESALCIRWPKCWSFSFSISSPNEYSGLIFFRIDWLDLLAVQGTLESSSIPQFKSINSSVLSFLYSPTLTSVCDNWKNHSFD